MQKELNLIKEMNIPMEKNEVKRKRRERRRIEVDMLNCCSELVEKLDLEKWRER